MISAQQPLLSVQDEAIAGSWESITILNQRCFELAENRNWPQLGATLKQRRQDMDQHFQRFPIGPDNAGFYQGKLSIFFKQEQQLLQLTQLSTKKHLYCVK
ncbi:MAG: hypothetical protein ACJAYG_001954 [Oceanicoccus sp.]|jgi:hypothetical protein